MARPAAVDDQGIPPTPQTKRKLTADPITRLWRAGELDQRQKDAADAIYLGVRLVCGDVISRPPSYERPAPGARAGRAGRIVEHETEWQYRMQRHYAEWVDEMTERRLPVGPVLDIIVTQTAPTTIDRQRRVRKGTTKTFLIEALDLYVKLRGW